MEHRNCVGTGYMIPDESDIPSHVTALRVAVICLIGGAVAIACFVLHVQQWNDRFGRYYENNLGLDHSTVVCRMLAAA
jgi:hypothetical protein